MPYPATVEHLDSLPGIVSRAAHRNCPGRRRERYCPLRPNCARVLDGLPVFLRAQAPVGGIYVMQARTPEEWRTFARRTLFAVERPYLG